MPDGANPKLAAATTAILGGISTANVVLGGVIQALVLYRQARDAARAAGGGGDFLSDAQLIALLQQDSQALVAKATQLLAKYAPDK